jgi:hypothetical protein
MVCRDQVVLETFTPDTNPKCGGHSLGLFGQSILQSDPSLRAEMNNPHNILSKMMVFRRLEVSGGQYDTLMPS